MVVNAIHWVELRNTTQGLGVFLWPSPLLDHMFYKVSPDISFLLPTEQTLGVLAAIHPDGFSSLHLNKSMFLKDTWGNSRSPTASSSVLGC